MSFNIIPVASEYQEIHPYSAVNTDSVKINTSLILSFKDERMFHPFPLPALEQLNLAVELLLNRH